MTGAELKAVAEGHWGRGWQKRMAIHLQCDVATIRRWTTGRTRIPGAVKVAMSPQALPPKEPTHAPA